MQLLLNIFFMLFMWLLLGAMYKTRNTGTRNGMRGTRGIGGMLPNIPGNVAIYSGECPQTFRGMSPNILGNVAKYSGQCRPIF